MQDQTYHQYHFLRRVLQFLIPASLFSLFLCFSSGFSLFPKPLIFYINTGLFSFFSHYLERKYMFLICNGILAIIAKSSVSSSKTSASEEEGQLSSTPDLSSTKAEATAHDVQQVPVESVEPVQDIDLVTEEEQGEDKGMQAVAAEEEQEEEEEEEEEVVVETTSSQALVILEEGEEEEEEEEEVVVETASSQALVILEEGEEKVGFSVKQEEEEEEEEEEEGSEELAASTEELNRRFEEFIRKMKEEIRIEAQQQLIAV